MRSGEKTGNIELHSLLCMAGCKCGQLERSSAGVQLGGGGGWDVRRKYIWWGGGDNTSKWQTIPYLMCEIPHINQTITLDGSKMHFFQKSLHISDELGDISVRQFLPLQNQCRTCPENRIKTQVSSFSTKNNCPD